MKIAKIITKFNKVKLMDHFLTKNSRYNSLIQRVGSQLTSIETLQEAKPRRLGFPNQIVGDSDSKPSKLDRQFRSDSDSNDNVVLTIAILIQI